MRWPTEPPKHVGHARLWRLLASCDRPTLPIRYRLSFAPDTQLSVRALTGLEFAAAIDSEGASDPTDGALSALISLALMAGDGRAFLTSGDADGLGVDEHRALGFGVLEALWVVSPHDPLIDAVAWDAALSNGAVAAHNVSMAAAMADCCDVSIGPASTFRNPRPDRWFGRCVGELTCGQLMAYRAAFGRVWKIRGGTKHER